ncbi:hypothetical protein DBV15_10913 [Temnothorax longispinosus]|uniref:Uncharacterized protein n=1 Tax=Temnothorax longispinosus TaxID=300112 RepID=A0A4S2KQ17_9HYME|nr:hypothetical protein DBV15_10913 [Temnothorax longispinosus]
MRMKVVRTNHVAAAAAAAAAARGIFFRRLMDLKLFERVVALRKKTGEQKSIRRVMEKHMIVNQKSILRGMKLNMSRVDENFASVEKIWGNPQRGKMALCSPKRRLHPAIVHLVGLVRICQNMQGKRRSPINITQSRQTVWRTCAGVPACLPCFL